MDMSIYERITHNRERILSLWLASALPQGYTLPSTKDVEDTRFLAPADYLLTEEMEALLTWLVSDEEPVKARLPLQEICRLKAVQSVNSSEALSFVFDLKDIVRLVLGDAGDTEPCGELCTEYRKLDKRIDQLMLLALDEYADCKERIMEIRIEEMRRLASTGKSA